MQYRWKKYKCYEIYREKNKRIKNLNRKTKAIKDRTKHKENINNTKDEKHIIDGNKKDIT